MPTSPHLAITNSPKVIVKSVRSAGSMWASTPTNLTENFKRIVNLFSGGGLERQLLHGLVSACGEGAHGEAGQIRRGVFTFLHRGAEAA